MLKNSPFIALLPVFIILAAFLATQPAQAGSLKAQMMARVPDINSQKAIGAIGENNQGYLEIRNNQTANAQLVQAENNDRKKVYAAIGRQQGVQPQLVGTRRAQQLAGIAKPGTWLQNSSGAWYKK